MVFSVTYVIYLHIIIIAKYVHTLSLFHSSNHPHLSKCIIDRWKEGNVLFNDALKTFYLRLFGVRHTVKDHSDSEKGNPLPPHRLLFLINSKGSFICTIPQTG